MYDILNFFFGIISLWCSFCHGANYNYADTFSWGVYSPTCDAGTQQSPIELGPNIKEVEIKKLPIKLINYNRKSIPITILNNGHAANLEDALSYKTLMLTGKLENNELYRLIDLHIHWSTGQNNGTEHSIHGKKYAAELHLVHINIKYEDLNEAMNCEDGVVVLGALLKIDHDEDSNSKKHLLTAIDDLNALQAGSKVECNSFYVSFDKLKSIKSFYTYVGSLTTPPCTESIRWIIPNNTFPISLSTMKTLWNIHLENNKHSNVRPLQPAYNFKIRLYTRK